MPGKGRPPQAIPSPISRHIITCYVRYQGSKHTVIYILVQTIMSAQAKLEVKFKGTLLNSDVASRLFQTYCCSFYGSQAWNLSSSSFEFICTAWNKAVRRIFDLPYNTHRYLLPFIVQVQTSHIRYQLVERFRTFFATCMSSENLLINLLALNAHFCNSPMSINRRYADELLVEKNDLTEEESGHAALLSSLLKL